MTSPADSVNLDDAARSRRESGHSVPDDRAAPDGDAEDLAFDAAVLGEKRIKTIAASVQKAWEARCGDVVWRMRHRMDDYASLADLAYDDFEERLRERKRLREEISEASSQVEALRVELAGLGSGGATKFVVRLGHADPDRHNQRMAAQAAKAAAAHYDVDVAADATSHTRLFASRQRKSDLAARWEAHVAQFWGVAKGWTPLERELLYVRVYYGEVCGMAFQTHRYLQGQALMILGLELIFFGTYFFGEVSMIFQGDVSLCGEPREMPCGALPGSELPVDFTLRAVSAAVLTLNPFAAALRQWTACAIDSHAEHLQVGLNPIPRTWSRLVLAAWDFRLCEQEQARWRTNLAASMQAFYSMDQAAVAVASKRPLLYVVSRTFMRLILIIILPAAAAALVAEAELYQNEAAAYLGLVGWGFLVPPIAASIVGLCMPYFAAITSFTLAIEPSSRGHWTLWLLLSSRVAALLPIFISSIRLAGGVGQAVLPVPESFWDGLSGMCSPSRRPCVHPPNDFKILCLIPLEFPFVLCLRPVLVLANARLSYALGLMSGRPSVWKKPAFEYIYHAAEAVYLQLLLALVSLLAPAIGFLAPLLLLAHFWWLLFVLENLSSRPIAEGAASFQSLVFYAHVAACLVAVLFATAIFLEDSNPPEWLGVAATVALLPVAGLSYIGIARMRNAMHAHQEGVAQTVESSRRQMDFMRAELRRAERHNMTLTTKLKRYEREANS